MGEIKLNTLTGTRILPQTQTGKTETLQAAAGDLPPVSKESFGLKTDFALKNGIDSSNFLRFKLENNLTAQNSQTVDNESERIFKTNGGEWRKPAGEEAPSPRFYHTGENTAGTIVFDQEFYQAKGTDKWIQLNPNGRLSNLPENKGKSRPENISEYDWKGWHEVSPAEVPADYTVEGKTVAFENPDLAENQKSLFKRYIIDNNLVSVWDEVRGERAIDAAIQKGAKLEAVSTGTTNADGKTVFTVKADEKSLEILRGELRDYKRGIQADAKTAEKVRTETNNLALDIPGAYWETGRNAIEMIINIPQDTGNMVLHNDLNHEIGDQPNFGRAKLGNYDELANAQKTANPNPFPRWDTSGVKYDFRSEAMNRDENGNIVDDGTGKGDVTTRVAGAIAPIVISKAVTPVESPQSLNLSRYSKPAQVSTGGLRNEIPLTESQRVEILEYAKKLGIAEKDIVFSENMNTSYKLLFGQDRLYVGTDVLPSSKPAVSANSRVSMRGAIAHELEGHRAAELAGKSQTTELLEEVQASIRAARFAPDLSGRERITLVRDALERLNKAGLKIRDVKGQLWITK